MIVFFIQITRRKNMNKRRYLILLFLIACWGGQFYIFVAWLENSIAPGCRAFNFALWRLKDCLRSSSGCGNDFCCRLLWRLKLNVVQLFGHYKSMIRCSCQSQLDVTRCPVMLITWETQQHHCCRLLMQCLIWCECSLSNIFSSEWSSINALSCSRSTWTVIYNTIAVVGVINRESERKCVWERNTWPFDTVQEAADESARLPRCLEG